MSWIKGNVGCPFAHCAESANDVTTPINPTDTQQSDSFLADIKQAEQATPLPSPPTAPPNLNDSQYLGNTEAYNQAKQAFDDSVAAFTAAAKQRGGAIAGVIGRWLATKPLVMLQELLDQPKAQMPIFNPAIGPVIVMREEHVIKCLERTDLFTVDRYAPEMARATDDKTKNPQAFSHFMLGTDNDALYRLDGVLLRYVVTPEDKGRVTAIARKAANQWLETTLAAKTDVVDVNKTLARDVPLRIVDEYLGVHAYATGQASVLPGLKGGDSYPLNPRLRQVFTFNHITAGIVPTWDHLHLWIHDAFRNIFNNGNPASPFFQSNRDSGIIATEYLTAYIYELIEFYKAQMAEGNAIPDTMLTRLLGLQQAVQTGLASDIEQHFTELLGEPLPDGELAKRLSDSMIRSNVFGTAVGASTNPQEAMTWIIDTMLRLQAGDYKTTDDSSFARAVQLATLPDNAPDIVEASETLRHYALEALRLQPQGEVILRTCIKDNTELGGVLIKQGTVVFVGYAAAMRDPAVQAHPLTFDVNRDEKLTAYLGQGERKNECPQSQTYLQHGYGRHKCLGRYASEITMQESLRALLRLGSLTRQSAVIMDEQNLYPASLVLKFTRNV